MSSFPVDGIIGEYSGNDLTIKATFTVFLGIALYNSIELLVLIFCLIPPLSWPLLLESTAFHSARGHPAILELHPEV